MVNAMDGLISDKKLATAAASGSEKGFAPRYISVQGSLLEPLSSPHPFEKLRLRSTPKQPLPAFRLFFQQSPPPYGESVSLLT